MTSVLHHVRLLSVSAITLFLFVTFIGIRSSAQTNSPALVGLRILVVDSQSSAEKALQRLKSGEDFSAVAKQVSTDITASEGGFMGWIDPRTLRQELRDALRNVAPGKLTSIVHVPSGFAILKVLAPDERKTIADRPVTSEAVNAPGAIRYPPNAGGKAEADLAYRTISKPDGWNQDLAAMCRIRQESLNGMQAQLLKVLDPASPDTVVNKSPLDALQMHYALANVYAYQGKMDQAVDHWEAAYKIATAKVPGAMPELEEVLGISYLHKSEIDNDVYSHPGDRCLFPPKPAASFKNTTSSLKAIDYLQKYLARNPTALDVKWLLNLAYSTIGKYPSGVPAQYVIPENVFDSAEDVPHFKDVAPAAGINLFSMSGGLIVDDFNNSGRLDIVTSDYGQCAPMHFFKNNGDGTFSDETKRAGLDQQLGGLNLIQADYDNDGCTDILVLRGAWEFPQRRSLLHNNCDGTFKDVTAQSGLAVPATQSQTAVWADIDNDGLLDLFVGNENTPAQLFRNNGNGTFKDISHSSGVDKTAYTKAVVANDFDNDGFVDFYVSNLDQENFLYHNNHDGTFTEVAAKAGVQRPGQSFAAWFFDYDNDGWPDLFVTSYYVSVDESIRSYLGLTPNAETMKLYKNQGDGTFKDVTADVGLDRVLMPMGSNFGDIDNDGFLDIYLGTGNPVYASLLPNVMLHNEKGQVFLDVTAASGTGELHKGHGVAFADIDRDGDEDLLTEIGGAVPGDSHAFRLFENPGNANSWLNLKLIGTKTNRSAIGARIKVTVEQNGAQQSFYRKVGSGGSFGASPLEQHIGLGRADKIVDVEIWWPASGSRQHFKDVALNRFIEVKELATSYRTLDYTSFKLGGTSKAASKPETGGVRH
jgi:tetratricopeptide (TPR) repeat protein